MHNPGTDDSSVVPCYLIYVGSVNWGTYILIINGRHIRTKVQVQLDNEGYVIMCIYTIDN